MRTLSSKRFGPSPMTSLGAIFTLRSDSAVKICATLAVIAVTLLTSCADVAAQSTTSGRRLMLQTGESKGLLTKDIFGKPCLDIEAAARAHVTNPKIFDHVISVVNRCMKPLKLKLCYVGYDRCNDINVPGKQRKDTIVGVGGNTFRFNYSEVR